MLLLFTGEKRHETDVSAPALGSHETLEPSVHKEKPDLGESGKSAASDMPEPEKMLSLAYQRDGEANNLLLESTPVNQSISEGHTDAAGVTCISGKKRSFTESTLTMQSVDLVESYGGAQSKRTAESIPDDDDLLSSILGITVVPSTFCFIILITLMYFPLEQCVAEKNFFAAPAGKRSSVLKIKPSPAAPEIASTKRFRSGSRSSAIKRKVLMDDVMVLHGEYVL